MRSVGHATFAGSWILGCVGVGGAVSVGPFDEDGLWKSFLFMGEIPGHSLSPEPVLPRLWEKLAG